MLKRRYSALLSALLLGFLLLVLLRECDLKNVKGEWSSTSPIYIRADGTIEPAIAPISTTNRITYTLTDDVIGNDLNRTSMVAVERDNIVLDGAGHLVACSPPHTGWDYTMTGISIGDHKNVTIMNFEIRGVAFGITGGNSCRITKNIIADNNYGIRGGATLEISKNQIINNSRGIDFQYSDNNLIFGNVLKNNYVGISLSQSRYNQIHENRIENSSWNSGSGGGIEFKEGANYNSFCHNDFLNERQFQPLASNVNYWDNGYLSGGNYWSDYTGSDAYSGLFQNETCKDGIGDTPYIIDQQNQDHYPLLRPWQEHLNPPVARSLYQPQVGYALQEITFNSSLSYDLDENIESFSWNFADGNITSTANSAINHTFGLPGIYDVSLTVFDEKGLSTTYSKSIRIMAIAFVYLSTEITSVPPNLALTLTGNLKDMFEQSLTNELVLLDYTYNGAGEWFPIASATTNDFGKFETVWFPPATGQFSIRAEWKGNETYAPVKKTTTLDVIFHESEYLFAVESNSTISSLAFESGKKELSFTVSGADGTYGYAKVTVAKSILVDVSLLEIRINNKKVTYAASSTDDYWLLSFNYLHSTHNVVMYFASLSIVLSNPFYAMAITGMVVSGVAIGLALFFARRKRSRTEFASSSLSNQQKQR